MNNERKLLLSDEDIDRFGPSDISKHPITGEYQYVRVPLIAEEVRNYYEHLIDEGKLRVVEEVEFNKKTIPFSDIEYTSCSGCSYIIYNDYIYCPKCGNKII